MKYQQTNHNNIKTTDASDRQPGGEFSVTHAIRRKYSPPGLPQALPAWPPQVTGRVTDSASTGNLSEIIGELTRGRAFSLD